jgi:hypothetical protein
MIAVPMILYDNRVCAYRYCLPGTIDYCQQNRAEYPWQQAQHHQRNLLLFA